MAVQDFEQLQLKAEEDGCETGACGVETKVLFLGRLVGWLVKLLLFD